MVYLLILVYDLLTVLFEFQIIVSVYGKLDLL